MLKVLFIDDEPMVLNALRLRLRSYTRNGSWSIRFAETPETALAELERDPPDVVVSDQRMPGMSGNELLEQVRRRCPYALRILMSGQVESSSLADGLRVAHQAVTKPCNVDELCLTVNHLVGLRKSLDNTNMQRIVNAIDRLPSPRPVFVELAALLDDPETELKDIAAVVERDPATALKLLKLANSAFYASVPVTQVLKAVQRLGLSTVRAAVTYAQVTDAIESSLSGCSNIVDQLQQRSLAVGRLAARLMPREASQTAYLAGLLHDVGGLVLVASLPELRGELFSGHPWPAARAVRERERLGFTHAEVGAYLLGTWGQPAVLVRAVGQQHAPVAGEDKAFDVPGAVHVAQRLAMEQDDLRPEYAHDYLSAVDVTLPTLKERAFGRDAA